MVDLKALAGLQSQRSQLDARRSQQSAQHYQQGLAAFARATRSDFQDREALREALEAWFEAIRQQRGNPAPYIALGYLFTLLGDARTAVMYLKAAQNLDPQHPDPPAMIAHLLSGASAAAPGAVAPAESLDESFEALEEQLLVWIKRIQSWPAPIPSAVSQGRQRLEDCHRDLAQALTQMQGQLGALEAEFDVTQLRTRLRPLEGRLQQYGQALRLSGQLVALDETIARLQRRTQAAIQGSEAVPDLEQMLDDCDAIADRLEALEAKGLDISALSAPYEALCQAIETLQDKLDEQEG